MKINLSIVAVFLWFNLSLLGQGPGYIGKKLVVAGGAAFSPALSAPTDLIPFNLTGQLCFEYAAKTRLSSGLSIGFAKTRYDNKASVLGLGNPTDDYKIETISIAAYAKIFSKKFVAPWGKYFLFGPVVGFNFTQHNNYMYLTQTVNDHDTLLMNFGNKNQTKLNLDLLIGFGKARIIRNKIVLDYGVNFHLLAMLSSLSEAEDNLSEEEYISKTTLERVRKFNRFNLFFKIGYLF